MCSFQIGYANTIRSNVLHARRSRLHVLPAASNGLLLRICFTWFGSQGSNIIFFFPVCIITCKPEVYTQWFSSLFTECLHLHIIYLPIPLLVRWHKWLQQTVTYLFYISVLHWLGNRVERELLLCESVIPC